MLGTFFIVAMLVSTATAPAASDPSTQPTPTPTPTALREIVRVKAAGGVCRTLDTLVSPVAQIVGQNDDEFVALKKPLSRFANTGAYALESITSRGSTALAAPGEGLSGDNGDAPDVYSPERTMAASNIDRLVGIIQHNLDLADRVMQRSWEAHPKNSDPAVDALRRRVQNIIDLQRVLAFRLDDSAGTYFSNSGVATSTPKRERGAFDDDLSRNLDASIASDATDVKNLLLSELPALDVAALRHGSVGEIAMALRVQKLALTIERERVARACDAAAAPSPRPSP